MKGVVGEEKVVIGVEVIKSKTSTEATTELSHRLQPQLLRSFRLLFSSFVAATPPHFTS